jgi:glycosyltransferase involved in cell wall biosynthesis
MRPCPRAPGSRSTPPQVLLVAETGRSGGIERYCVDIASLLGQEVALACLCPPECSSGAPCWLADRCMERGLPLISIEMGSREWRRGLQGLTLLWEGLGRPLVHVNGRRGNFLSLVAHAMMPQYRYVTTVHGLLGLHSRRNLAYRVVDLAACFRAEAVVAVSSDTRRRLLDAGIPADKMTVIRNALRREDVDSLASCREERTAAGSQAPRIGFLGRLSPEKGLADFVRLVRRIGQDAPGVCSLVAGTGPLAEWLADEAADLTESGRLCYLGEVDHPQAILARIDLLLIPSAGEGLPYSLLEAMAAGCVVVAYGVGGITDVITDSSLGRVVHPGDLEAMARETIALAADGGRVARIGARAAAHIERQYLLDQREEALLGLYGSRGRRT